MCKSKISVIIATHNRAALLPDSVKSIQEQSLDNIEIIIIDDASVDDTSQVIKKLEKEDQRVIGIRLFKNSGPGAARNRGIEIAQGEYIAIMDDDDFALPKRLEIESKILDENSEIGLVFSAVEWLDKNLNPISKWPGIVIQGDFPQDTDEIFKLLYLKSNKIPNPTVMFRQELFKWFKYPEHIWGPEDWMLFLKMAAKGIRMFAISEPLVLMRRDREHLRLMKSTQKSFDANRQALDEINEWLDSEEIERFSSFKEPIEVEAVVYAAPFQDVIVLLMFHLIVG